MIRLLLGGWEEKVSSWVTNTNTPNRPLLTLPCFPPINVHLARQRNSTIFSSGLALDASWPFLLKKKDISVSCSAVLRLELKRPHGKKVSPIYASLPPFVHTYILGGLQAEKVGGIRSAYVGLPDIVELNQVGCCCFYREETSVAKTLKGITGCSVCTYVLRNALSPPVIL